MQECCVWARPNTWSLGSLAINLAGKIWHSAILLVDMFTSIWEIADVYIRTFLFSNEMLYNDVRHVISECVTILVQTVHRTEDQLIVCYSTILTPNSLKHV